VLSRTLKNVFIINDQDSVDDTYGRLAK
jgi:hypothetical protein